jgi:hypothetical protein
MFKVAKTNRTAHTKQKPKPRFVTKAHRLEHAERESAVVPAGADRRTRDKTTKR